MTTFDGDIGMEIPTDGSLVSTAPGDSFVTNNPLPDSRFTAIPVPEPSTFALTALAALGLLRRRR